MSEDHEYLLIQGDAAHLPIPSKSVSLVLGSPPYCAARSYLENGVDLGIARDARSWVDWMLEVTTEAVRVSRGLVLWVCAGVTRDHCYQPACEGLLYRWWEAGGHCWRPCIWHRVGIPGSGGKKWLRSDTEYVLAFKGPDNDFFTANTACGKPPKWAPGGEMSYRDPAGKRRNQWGGTEKSGGHRKADGSTESYVRPSHYFPGEEESAVRTDGKLMYRRDPDGSRQHTKNTLDGTMESQTYYPPAIANPGTFHEWEFTPDEAAWLDKAYIHTTVGGGQLGSALAHESEAPFPEALVEFFVKSFSPEGGRVLDPFGGSGTTAAVSIRHGRKALGIDIRRSQAELATRRIADSMRPVSRLDQKALKPLPGQGNLF